MEIKGALIKVSEVTFAIIEVEENIISDDNRALNFIKKNSIFFPRVPIVLMALDEDKKPTYYGKKEITHLLVNIHPNQIPWKRYVISKK